MDMRPYYEADGITIYHGDSLEVLPALEGLGAIVTDPPYSSGGAYRGDRANATSTKYVRSDAQHIRPEFAGDTRDQRGFLVWCGLWLTAARAASIDGAFVATFIDWRQLPTMTDALQVGGWVWRGIAVWSKKYGRPRAGGFTSACEFLPWGTNGPLVEHQRYPAGVFECTPAPVEDREHIAQKPEPVAAWSLSALAPGTLVCDPFMGCGTTLVQAKAHGFRAIGVDIMEANCEIAARRLQQGVLFGLEA